MGAKAKGVVHAAIAYVVRSDDRILVVWNRRYRGWTMPGGLVEPGEDVEDAVVRELYEETGAEARTVKVVYDAPADPTPDHPDRAGHVVVFEVHLTPSCIIAEGEPGCPVGWFTREDFLASCPFAPFYLKMFIAIGEG